MKAGSYEVNDQLLIGQADNHASFHAGFTVSIEGRDFEFIKPVKQKFTDPVRGEVYEPVVVVPPVLITPARGLLISASPEPRTVQFSVSAMKDIIRPGITVSKLNQWQAEPTGIQNMERLSQGSETNFSVLLKPVIKERQNGSEVLTGSISTNGSSYSSSLRTINYDHIPGINYFRMPAVQVVTLDLKTAGKKIGYIEGAGDYVPAALEQMGYQVTILSDQLLSSIDLSQFDAIITGVRAYNIKESLNMHYSRLMSYIERGGNLIVQYNTSNQLGQVKSMIGPYPFSISRVRVSDETAAIRILNPAHPVLNYPNKITAKDFEGWVQERSIYHAQNWDPRYETIFGMNDPDEKDDKGSLITARYGKGNFVYTGLVFYRELPAGVPGAYRLLANLIALNHSKRF